MAAFDFHAASSGTAGYATASPKGGRGWQVVRDNFDHFLKARPDAHKIGSAAEAIAILLGTGKKNAGPSREEELFEAAQDRVLENIIAHINEDTPEGKHGHEVWSRARNANLEVREALKASGFKSSESGVATESLIGRKSTRDACAALFPQDWCRLLDDSNSVMAELAVDAIMNSVVDSFLDGAVELLQMHEGWALPAEFRGSPRKAGLGLGKSQSSPSLGSRRRPLRRGLEGMPGPAPESPKLQPLPVPAVWRQQNRPFQSYPSNDAASPSMSSSNSHGPTEGFVTSPGHFSVRGGRGTGPEGDGWALRRFHACQPLESYTRRIQKFTEQQRPRRRIRKPESDPLGPKWSLPMLATNFPEVWDRTAPAVKKEPDTSQSGAFDDDDSEWDEEEGYTWLQRKNRDGQTVFPYSLVSHRAFIESYNRDPALKAKALQVAPLRFTENW
eukprot:TRINITY_DN24950_c0_g1_i2.p1 TRINITY_DN24950_c0_g1~~TRINITY_DN24950_c0_g1_i2.p1  ORF type:complete len:445 (-),score=89.07 TRINITY_DN24950_c0_g1_i2:35-1369(-)